MKELFNYKNVKNNPKTSTFDTSSMISLTAKPGELLPVYWDFMMPGDKTQINLKHFTRTRPVSSPAFAQMKEYFDVFFVPARLIWRNFPASITQMTNASVYAQSEGANSPVPLNHPSITSKVLFGNNATNIASASPKSVYETLMVHDNSIKNHAGFHRPTQFLKLAHLLGYGPENIPVNDEDFEKSKAGQVNHYTANSTMNLYPFCVYQKIYQDHFRNSQWERSNPSTYNLDYNMTGVPYKLPVYTDAYWRNNTMFDMQYANYEKDMFFGLLPNSQYGAEASLNMDIHGTLEKVSEGTDSMVPTDDGLNKLTSTMSILKFRHMQFLQKWKEIAQSGSTDYRTQVQKHLGVTIPEELGFRSKYVGGTSNFIDINEVVNTALDNKNEATLKGKAVGTNNGDYINFEAPDYGYIMIIYHCKPLIQYGTSGINGKLLATNSQDFPIPELDSIGLESVPQIKLTQKGTFTRLLGYASRYIDYKTNIDRVTCDFLYTTPNWNLMLTDEDLSTLLSGSSFSYINFIKINPKIVDDLFGTDADSYMSSDQLLINANLDMKITRHLDYNGMPY
nr:MAG TPA: Major capsid protein [Microviridae sp.]